MNLLGFFIFFGLGIVILCVLGPVFFTLMNLLGNLDTILNVKSETMSENHFEEVEDKQSNTRKTFYAKTIRTMNKNDTKLKERESTIKYYDIYKNGELIHRKHFDRNGKLLFEQDYKYNEWAKSYGIDLESYLS